MEFEQNGRSYGKTMEFSFWCKKNPDFPKKNWEKNTSGLRNVVVFRYRFTSSTNLLTGNVYSASLLLGRMNTCRQLYCSSPKSATTTSPSVVVLT